MIESNVAGWERQNGYDGRNLTTHSTGARVSLPVIVDLAIAGLNARPVNSGVMSALRIQSKKPPATPLLMN
jgi:hypothetical protein